jgi:hypothetical protein
MSFSPQLLDKIAQSFSGIRIQIAKLKPCPAPVSEHHSSECGASNRTSSEMKHTFHGTIGRRKQSDGNGIVTEDKRTVLVQASHPPGIVFPAHLKLALEAWQGLGQALKPAHPRIPVRAAHFRSTPRKERCPSGRQSEGKKAKKRAVLPKSYPSGE